MQRRLLSALALLLVVGAAPPACSETLEDEPLEPVPDSPKAAMTGLVAAATTLLPLTLDEGSFADPAKAETIRSALASLAAHTEVLEGYAWGQDPGFAWLADSLARDVADAAEAFEARRYDEARFRSQRLTANCVTCHSRLPSAQDSDLGGHLLASIDTSGLHPDETAQLQLATRQFAAAAATYEGLLREPPTSGGVGRLWYFVDYLVVALRVLGEPARARPVLAAWAKAESVPAFMRQDVQAWLADLDAGVAAPPAADAGRDQLLARARELVAQGKGAGGSPSGQRHLVKWIAASAHLHRAVDGAQARNPELAEAWYLLGVVEARLGHSPWLSQPEYYLETAVRAAPGSTFARDALAHLEWHVAVQYTGSGGSDVPADVQAVLDELQRLVDGAARPTP